jgi:hypothetical protein
MIGTKIFEGEPALNSSGYHEVNFTVAIILLESRQEAKLAHFCLMR